MMLVPVVFLVIGVVFGRFGMTPGNIDLWITVSLSVVIVAAGIDVGSKKEVLQKLLHYRAKVFLIPLGTIAGTLLGGILLGMLIGIPMNEAAAVSAGFGYYSLSAGIISGLGGAGLGALAFMSNIFREVLSLLIIPFAARFLGPYCAVAPGGATTMDTTLGVISSSTNEETTMLAMFNGVILSSLVPVLVPFLYRI